MTTFRVWAPRADRVEVDLGGRRIAMGEAGRGWWEVEVADAGPGTDYAYRVDGSDPLPDPRSAHQPHGVNGPSRVVDHRAFRWQDGAWRGFHLPSAVLYELHIGTFSAEGTFDGAVAHLDHLVQLGVTAVELLPVAQFPGCRNWGYDGVDLYAPHDGYGGPDGLRRLVDACHARGLGVVLDVVYNHLGPEGNHLERFAPYFTSFYATPWGQAVNYDRAASDEVRRFVIDNALSWLRDYHFDALRLDAIHAIVDTSATHLLEQLAVEVAELAAAEGRSLWLIAESDLNDPRVIRPRDAGGHGIDAQWSDDFHHALHTVLTGEHDGYYRDFGSLADLATALEHVWVYAGRWSPTRDRTHGRPPTGLPGWCFLGYLQNHDQVGNRAVGDRISSALSTDRLKVGAALVLTAPFVPMLFQGEEWAASTPFQYFTSHDDPELGRLVRQGRRAEFAAFGWTAEQVPDPQDPATFERSKLDWEEPGRSPHAEMLDWYRTLIELRRSTPGLGDGRLDRVRVRVDEEAGWLVVERGQLRVAANLGPSPVTVALEGGTDQAVLAASHPGISVHGDHADLPSDSVVIVGPSG
ncbi:MAG TPA: malto-oligosyltrehalose trehalohydrolase [Acidimicrobiales bacterium]|jgi:maltooligosyltrehalose trehalohydrolase|nr:malto-oligosyltrehalose trehalohydrolase [Acidimicrobiales bacterium]